jgi:3-oxoacid CoA-transferase subunit A
MNKLYANAEAALAGIVQDGMTLAVGGFGLCGIPEALIAALRASGARSLTIASNNAGIDGVGLGLLLETRQICKMISSYVGENGEFERQYLAGELEVEFCPQGTLAERMRAGGAGIAGFYTRTGVGTLVEEGKEVKLFHGVPYLLEEGIHADVALVKAWKGDAEGNLVYRYTAQNFNPGAAMCGRITVAEVEQMVEVGELDPNHIHTPGIFVQRLILNPAPEHRIERVTTREV